MTAPATFANAAPMALRCPKCAGDLTTYERSGVVVDQCRECRGIWLDRGELERLIDVESRHGFAMAAATAPSPAREDRRYREDDRPRGDRDDRWDARGYRSEWGDDDDDRRGSWDRDRDRGYDRDRDRGRPEYRPAKKKSLLGELLEGFGD